MSRVEAQIKLSDRPCGSMDGEAKSWRMWRGFGEMERKENLGGEGDIYIH